MAIIADISVALVALLHGYFLVLEMFLWDKPAGLRAFGQKKEDAEKTKVLAANQAFATASSQQVFFTGCCRAVPDSTSKYFFSPA
jgi:putative membrane protein